jgi:hypothetical protein
MRVRTALAALTLMVAGVLPAVTHPAVAASTPPAAQPGTQPSVAGGPGSSVHVAYTATDSSVDVVDAGTAAVTPLGGRVIGGPALIDTPENILRPADSLAVFARGTDNAVWWRHQTLTGWGPWASLGGQVSARPSAAATTNGQFGQIAVFAAGPHGVMWMRNLVANAWTPWQPVPGHFFQDPTFVGPLRADTGPSAAYDDHGNILIAAVSQVGSTYLLGDLGLFGFAGMYAAGRTAWSPAVTLTPDQAVVLVHGVDNRLWFRSRPNPMDETEDFGPWTTLGGRLTSAVTASTSGSTTYVAALGTDNRIWMRSGTWPTLGPWERVG